MFQVSVIIPVYNAAKFIENAVQSGLKQPQVGEIILVEDGSMDNSLEICKMLEASNPKIKHVCHPNHENRGAAISRNLGIRNSNYDFIAFLDADDWYESDRFKIEEELFKDLNVYAIYNISSISFQNKETLYGTRLDILKESDQIGKSFYQYLIECDIVLGHTNCNTFRKEVFDKVGFFDPRLRLHQDTEMWHRIAREYIWNAAELSRPVSVARRHEGNRITNRSTKSEIIYQLVWIDNLGLSNLKKFEKKAFIYHLARAVSNPIQNPFLRKSILHGFQLLANLTRPLFIPLFYRWGMKRYKLYKD